MNEAEISIAGMNRHIQPELAAWGWEIVVYLFAGGLVAGLLVLCGIAWRRGGKLPESLGFWGPMAAPLILGAGLFALFLDLEYKLHAFRFYTTFQAGSPMSWGAWILSLVIPGAALFAWAAWKRRAGSRLPFSRTIATVNIMLGVALGIYTGILLGAMSARPVWNSPVLGPLFLVSGLSGAAALLYVMERDPDARHNLGETDKWLLAVEAAVLALFLLGLATGGQAQQAAFGLFSGGKFTALFWIAVVFLGIAMPPLMEKLEARGKLQPSLAAPFLVLLGGLSLRAIILLAGQASSWEVL